MTELGPPRQGTTDEVAHTSELVTVPDWLRAPTPMAARGRPLLAPEPMFVAEPVPVSALATAPVPTTMLLEADDRPASRGGLRSRLLRDNLAVAAGTAVGRVTGLVQLAAMYWALDKTLRDTYLLANNTPNIIYELILGGVLTATLVPLFTDNLTHHDDDATSAVVSTTLVALLVATALFCLASPVLIWLYSLNAGKGVSPHELRSVGTNLAFLFAPQVFFYGAMAVGSALLNARKRFFAAAWAPVLENLTVIAMLLSLPHFVHGSRNLDQASHSTELRLILGLGTTASIVVMAVALLPALRRAGVRIRFKPDFHHPAVKRALVLSGWTIGYVIANQIAAQIVLILARPGSGNVTNYSTAFIFFQLPHGLLAVSLMTTFQPDLARSASHNDEEGFRRRFLLGLRLLAMLIVPAAVGYFVISHTFVDGLHRAHFTLFHLDLVGIFSILGGFALGLIGFSTYLFTLRAFYARKDTRTPFILNCFENLLNIVFALLLVHRYGVVGLAYSYAIAYTIAAVVSLAVLRARIGAFGLRTLAGTCGRLAVAAVLMASAVFTIASDVSGATEGSVLLALAASIAAGIVVYIGLIVVMGVPQSVGLGRRSRG